MTGGLTKDRFEEGCNGVLRLTAGSTTSTHWLETHQNAVFRDPTRFDVIDVGLYGQLVVGNPALRLLVGN